MTFELPIWTFSTVTIGRLIYSISFYVANKKYHLTSNDLFHLKYE